MFCSHCGNMLPDKAKFCDSCGAPVERKQENAPVPAPVLNPVPSYDQSYTQPKEKVGFIEAVKLFFLNYANFKGRSRRSEYWWFTLFNMIVGFLIGMIIPDLFWIWSLIILIPSLSLCVRRLHDVGKSGWWYLLILIPLVGSIILIVWCCKDSTEDNQWGPNPKR